MLAGVMLLTGQARASEFPGAIGQIVINPGGANNPDGSDGVRLVVNETGSGYDDIRFANTSQWCCSAGAPFLNVGGQLFGTAYASVTNWTRVSVLSTAGTTTVNGSGTGGTGSGAVTIRYEADRGGRTYVMDRNVSYTYPNNYATESYTFTIPSGNTDTVKWYYGGDTAPGDSDQGYGIMIASPLREVISLNPSSQIQFSLREVAGSKAFNGAVSQHYSAARTTIQSGGDIGFNVTTSLHDAGLMAQWNLGSTPGVQTARFQQVVDFQALSLQGVFDRQVDAPGQVANLNLTVQNSLLGPQSNFGFTFDLPAGTQIDNGSSATNACGGTLTATAGTGQVVLTGSTSVAMTTGCVVSVPVIFPSAGVFSIGQGSVSAITSPMINRVGSQTINIVTGYVAGQPIALSPPTVPATPMIGQPAVGDGGFWDGTQPLTYDYQWLQCDAQGDNCSDITGATTLTYTPVAGDAGHSLRLRVRTTNSVTSSPSYIEAISAPSGVLGAPQNSSAPTVSGSPAVGGTLTAGNGTWTDSPTSFAYQWQRCDANGGNCVDIAGATSGTYSPTVADQTSRLRVVVTASNAVGSASAPSAATSAVTGPVAPNNTALPTISGTVRAGATLTAADGTWTGTTPIQYTYQWQRCDAAGANCVDISGATGASYVASAADISAKLRVVVTADNAAAGTVSAMSGATSQVADFTAPSNTAKPTIDGTAKVGEELTATTGTWTGHQPIDFTYQWQRCDAAGANCVDITGATAAAYRSTLADAGSTLRVVVTADNAATGTVSETSDPTSPVAEPDAPVNTSAPTVSGTAKVGDDLTADPGTWTGFAPVTTTYQWQRCDAAGTNCVDISGATGATYRLTDADEGGTVRVVVTATGPTGRTQRATSAVTGAVAPSATPDVSPIFGGNLPAKSGGRNLVMVTPPKTAKGSPTINVGCSAEGDELVRCTVIVYADRSQLMPRRGLNLPGQQSPKVRTGRVVIGTAVTVSKGDTVMTGTVKLNAAGKRMLRNRAGGIDAEALVRGSLSGGGVVESSSRARLRPPTQAIAPTDGLFPINSSKLTAASLGYARRLRTIMPSRVKSVICIGHTDSRGSEEFNLDLGKRRATAVCRALRKVGVRWQRVRIVSRGESTPRATNETPAGRALNRRVEVQIRY